MGNVHPNNEALVMSILTDFKQHRALCIMPLQNKLGSARWKTSGKSDSIGILGSLG